MESDHLNHTMHEGEERNNKEQRINYRLNWRDVVIDNSLDVNMILMEIQGG